MNDKQLYAKILGIEVPWSVTNVGLRLEQGELEVNVEIDRAGLRCPQCGKPCPRHDSRPRRWRHLDTCQYRTILCADVPRVDCTEHGVHQVIVPWAEPRSGFTALFEALVIDWLKEASLSAVARLMNLSQDQVSGIMERAVERGLERRKLELPEVVSVDETSFQKRHEYVTVVSDPTRRQVLHVADDRTSEALSSFWQAFPAERLARIRAVAMDMCAPYVNSTVRYVPDAAAKIAFDKFHVAKLLADAVDRVRRTEHKELTSKGDRRLAKSRYLWLEGALVMSDERWSAFERLRNSTLRTARAYAIKETAMSLWNPRLGEELEHEWRQWYGWAIRSRLEPMKKAARTVKRHLGGILNAIRLNITNAGAESINAAIQKVKRMAHGFRNRDRFRNAIYFHLGGLDLYPKSQC